MTSPRFRRLDADYHKVVSAFAGHPFVRVEPIGLAPPDRYRAIYDVPGLRLGADGIIDRVGQHVVEIFLPANYPREKPYCTSIGEVFHPNFGAYVCIADYWSAGQSLVDVIVQIGDMLQYKLFNTRSPLNAVAANWATENVAMLPLGNLELLPLEPEIRLGQATDRSEPSSQAMDAQLEGTRNDG